MKDKLGRNIDYMRVSVTDRCNLRCKYCMPEGIELADHSCILSFEEILRICEAAISLEIVNFKITGGEPLVRRGLVDFIKKLKTMPGARQVTLTTNGLLLSRHLDDLCRAGLDAVNVSVDTLDKEHYLALTGAAGEPIEAIRAALSQCVDRGLRTKVNAVLLEETFNGIDKLALLAKDLPIDVRFIELMPIGEGVEMKGVSMETALARLKELYPSLQATDEKRGNGPASYFKSHELKGRIGFISAVSNKFCDACNRVRLTSTGTLKPCLCFEEGVDLRNTLRDGSTDAQLREALRISIENKPSSHCFSELKSITEQKAMHQIGG